MADMTLIEQLKTYFLSKTGGNIIKGHFTPDVTDSYNLGASDKRFDTIYVRNVVADMVSGEESRWGGFSG